MTAAGLPHSGTPGSQPACGSPGTIAACRALLRLSVPRHPPCALSSLGRISSGPTRKPAYPLEREQTHTSDTPLVLTFPTTLPIPELSNQTRYRGVLCVVQPPPGKRAVGFESFRVPRDLTRRSKGGDPAAGSPTATLLRLRPSHRARLRRLPPASGLGHRLRALPTSMA